MLNDLPHEHQSLLIFQVANSLLYVIIGLSDCVGSLPIKTTVFDHSTYDCAVCAASVGFTTFLRPSLGELVAERQTEPPGLQVQKIPSCSNIGTRLRRPLGTMLRSLVTVNGVIRPVVHCDLQKPHGQRDFVRGEIHNADDVQKFRLKGSGGCSSKPVATNLRRANISREKPQLFFMPGIGGVLA